MSLLCDLGGDGPLLHLAHANGFPPGTYRLLVDNLSGEYHVIALPSRPLWPETPPTSVSSWHPLADDLVDGLDKLGLSGITGIGHSLGGVLTLWAAIKRPDLFRAVVLVEPVILPPAQLRMVRLLRLLGLQQHLPLVQGALRRRRVWPDRAACFEHFRDKRLFGGWSDAALSAYVEYGTGRRPDGQVELIYPPEWEAQIYATVPTGIWRDVPRLRTPALVIRGENSSTFLLSAQDRMARHLPGAHYITIRGAGHLVPMERPEEIAAAIRAFVDSQSAA